MILEIKRYPNSVLKKKSEKVAVVTPEIKELIFDMTETIKAKQGVGLAAPQVGVSKRVIVVETPQGVKGFINPEILDKSSEKETAEEGCLCVPGLFLKIKRAKEIEIEAIDGEGKKIKIQSQGFVARIFQHEIDHLNGILIIDRLSLWQRLKARKKIKNSQKFRT